MDIYYCKWKYTNTKWKPKKYVCVFLLQKYVKFCSIFLGNFIKQNPLIFEV